MSFIVKPICGPNALSSLSQPDQYDWLLAYVKATMRPFVDPLLLLLLALALLAVELLELELLPHPAANAAAAARTATTRNLFTLRNVPLLSAFRSFRGSRQRRRSRARFGCAVARLGLARWRGTTGRPSGLGSWIRHVPEDLARRRL